MCLIQSDHRLTRSINPIQSASSSVLNDSSANFRQREAHTICIVTDSYLSNDAWMPIMGRNIWVVMIFSMQPLLLQDLARNRVMDISKESVTSIEIPQDSCTWIIVFGHVT